MISLFRRFFDSKLGIPITLAFLALIAIAFTASDVGNTGTFGGIAGGDRGAVVGDEKIGTGELSREASLAVNRIRQQDPTITPQRFVEEGGFDDMLDGLFGRYAMAEWAESYGFRAGDNQVNRTILDQPGLVAADGTVNRQEFDRFLSSIGMSEAQFRKAQSQRLLAQQVLVPATVGTIMPEALARRYAAIAKEERKGAVGFIQAERFRPSGNPTDKQLQEYYTANRDDFERPERRVIRYATFGLDALGDRAVPTEAELRARHAKNQEEFAGQDERGFTQLIVPTEAAARSIRESVQGGESLEAAARRASLETTRVAPTIKDEVATNTSQAVANAIFATERGRISAPARSSLGWVIARVDSVRSLSGQSFEQARPGLLEEMTAEKRQRAISDLAVSIEEQVNEGAALSDLAGDLNATVQTTQPLLADGRVYEQRATAPPVLATVLANAFEMDEGEPQLAELQAGEQFMIYDVADITKAAVAPLSEVRDGAIAAWKNAEGDRLAGEAANRILKRVEEGQSLAAAMRAEKTALLPADQVSYTREQVDQLQQQGQAVPAPIALLFSMAEGTAKRLEGPNDVGWFIIDLEDVIPGEIAPDDPSIALGQANLQRLLGNEYAEQLTEAVQQEVGVERNEPAIEAVRARLLGQQ